MNRRIHQGILALIILALAPVALVSVILASSLFVTVVVVTVEEGVHLEGFVILGIALLATLLAIYPYYRGPELFFRLSAGFLPSVRKALFQYYVIVTFLFGSLFALLIGGNAPGIPPSAGLCVVGISVLVLLFTPLVLVLFSKSENGQLKPHIA